MAAVIPDTAKIKRAPVMSAPITLPIDFNILIPVIFFLVLHQYI